MIKKKRIVRLFSALPVLMILWPPASFSQTSSAVPEAKRYWGQTPPGDAPEVFAPGLVSLPERSNLKIVFSPDGRECLIGVRVNGVPTILYAKFDNGHWTKPEKAAFIVADQHEKEPFFTPDGSAVFFVRFAAIWVSRRAGSSWSAPELLGSPVNVMAEQYHPTVTMDGTLYFCSNRGGAYNIYRSKNENGRYTAVEKLDAVINAHEPGSDGAYDPSIAPDESYILFSSERPGGFGQTDQYVSFNEGGHWTRPKNLGPKINTAGTEYGSFVSPDGKYYFFARLNKDRRADLYWTRADFIKDLKQTGSGTQSAPFGKTDSIIPASAASPGQPLPGDTPVVFAPGIISLKDRFETYPTFSPDGQEMFFSVVNAAWTAGEILHARLEDGVWSKPERTPFSADPNINWESFLSPDGKRLFFSSNRPPSSPAHIDLWMVERKSATTWSDPIRLPDSINSSADDGSACVTNNGTLYFHSTRGGGIGGSELYRSIPVDNKYSRVENLGNIIKTGSKESEPYMAPDEKLFDLYFADADGREGRVGFVDLFSEDGRLMDRSREYGSGNQYGRR